MSRNPLATLSGTLRAARGLIEAHGFSAGLNNAGGYRRSVDWGAIGAHEAIVRCMGAKRGDAIACLAASIGRTGEGSLGIEAWANQHGRTQQHVLLAFDQAIDAAQTREATAI